MSKPALLLVWLFFLVLISGMIWGGCGGATPQEQAGSARKAALETDLRLVKDAVDAYFAFSGTVPTEDSRLPPAGEYAPIDFDASYTQDGNTMSLYPDFLIVLPRHHDEGIWRISRGMQVSVDIDPDKY
jgi:hypothetical protein